MKVFSFDPASRQAAYEQHGWVHVPSGATDEFCDYVRSEIAATAAARPLERQGVTVSKEQFVLRHPDGVDLSAEVFDCVSALCGLDRDRLVLSERHVNVYSSDAAPRPRPHKDRFASQVSVGISIEIPEGSQLAVWPDADLGVNPLQRAGLAETLPPDATPEVVLAGADVVTIADSPGDVQIFPGSSVWHTRWNPAGAVIAYFKCNVIGSDPLGEDLRSSAVREASLTVLDDPQRFREAQPCLSRRFESVTREYALQAGQDWLNVQIWGHAPIQITEAEFEVLRSLDGAATVDDLLRAAGGRTNARERALRRMVELGAVDLVGGS